MSALLFLIVIAAAFRGGLQPSARASAQPGETQLTAPRLAGADGKGRPFVITAVSATRSSAPPQRIQLDHPVLVSDEQGPDNLKVVAARGTYDPADEKLFLEGGVSLTGARGEFQAPSTVFDVKSGQLVGSGRVQTRAQSSEVQARSVTADTKNRSVTYSGGVRSRLNLD
ncbi:LPS export ABC transporter periplasmic protein LptC [Phenylobacterium deserti]|uniref:LPS export ABC transporter periplasmic protein LptC n=1 Tax=Phenylobacterium deserti TaxID=1914756 RepID=UPI001401DBD0|nr:LPS export ABC transporter periplasmic protein LptC [Phenylobacterium deserti]